ncbi:hypothetical protein [Fictibacillus phosphorivorans]|uniref:hypothetical protein n=1 Tax=Fictibacillus phosphorivorans TaxID=1221500 RepID=UPI002040C0D3|nr:hypothetical protein [Fictibacillus phosphorivorans]
MLKTDAAIFYFFGLGFYLVVDAGTYFPAMFCMRFFTALLTSSFFVTPHKLFLHKKL